MFPVPFPVCAAMTATTPLPGLTATPNTLMQKLGQVSPCTLVLVSFDSPPSSQLCATAVSNIESLVF